MDGGRLTRGRTYARKGQVLDLTIGPGSITGTVQGSRRSPYEVEITLAMPDEDQWERVVVALAAQAGYAARLLAGELPHEVEDVFADQGVSLLPSTTARLTTGCTCPDVENPCKHVAAVCCLAAESLDRDPFLLFTWRGRDRDAVLERLRELRVGAVNARPVDDVTPDGLDEPTLTDCTSSFWKAGPGLAEVRLHPVAAELPSAVLRYVRRGVLEVRGRDVVDILEPLYADLVEAAEQRAGGTELPATPVTMPVRPATRSRGSRRGRGPGGG